MAAMSWTLYETVSFTYFFFCRKFQVCGVKIVLYFSCINFLVLAGIQTSGSEVKNCENH